MRPGHRRRRTPDARPGAAAGPTRAADVAARAVGSTASMVRGHLWVSGRVQGVGFRYFVQRQAALRGLSGFVRNLPDRRVEVVAEGPRADVEALAAAVGDGPPGASVHGVDLTWEAPRGESGFVIQPGGVIHD